MIENQSSLQMIDDIGRYRWAWRVLAIFFFTPVLIYIFFGPEKRFKAARASGDVEAARDAVSSMRMAALIGTPIGIAILLTRFL